MQSNETAIVVEELALEDWLLETFRAGRTAPRAGRAPAAPRAAALNRVAGARALYWCWLAAAMLALVLA